MKRVRILIVGDTGFALERIESRLKIFWPPDIPMKTTAVYCAWSEEAIEAIGEYRPDILLLNYKFRKDEKTGIDVARWIDQNYRKPIRVAAYSEDPDEDLPELFKGAQCVRYFIRGDRIRNFVEEWAVPNRFG